MEMKFSKFKKDERCKKLERSLKLSLLRKNGKLTNDEPIWNDTDAQNWSFTALSPKPFKEPKHDFKTEHNIVSSNNNSPRIMTIKKNRYITYEPVIASSNVQQSPRQNNCFDNDVASSLNMNKYHCQINRNSKVVQRDSLLTNENSTLVVQRDLYEQTKNIKYDKDLPRLQQENSKNNSDNNYNPRKTNIANLKEKSGRTFFNWKIMLNKDGHLLIKGTLESGQTARSKPILRRLTATSVQSIFLHVYYLEGNIVDNENELPEYVRGKFYNGFPDDWENVYLLWKVFISEGSKLSFHWPTKITDSDDDLNSEVTNLTLQSVKENKNKCQKSCNNICNNIDYSSRIKTGNNVSNLEIPVPSSKNFVQVFNTTKIIQDNKILNKENQQQHKNVKNVNQPQCVQKKHTLKDIIQEDKINIIINNLLHKDCPKEYIVKIVQMFNCLEDVLSYRVGTNDTNKLNRDDNDSGLYSSQLQSNETVIHPRRSCMPQYHNMSPITNRISHNNCNRENMHEISNTIPQQQLQNNVEKLDKRDSEELESEIYAGMPKIIFQKVLENKRASLKQDKQKQRKGIINSTSMTKSHITSQKRVKKKHRIIHRSSSSDSDIDNDIQNFVSNENKKDDKVIRHNALKQQKDIIQSKTISFTQGSVSYEGNLVYHDHSVSITEDEEPRVDDTNRIGTHPREKKSSFKYNCTRDISTTDDEVKLPGEINYKKHLHTMEVIKHSAKKPRIINRH